MKKNSKSPATTPSQEEEIISNEKQCVQSLEVHKLAKEFVDEAYQKVKKSH